MERSNTHPVEDEPVIVNVNTAKDTVTLRLSLELSDNALAEDYGVLGARPCVVLAYPFERDAMGESATQELVSDIFTKLVGTTLRFDRLGIRAVDVAKEIHGDTCRGVRVFMDSQDPPITTFELYAIPGLEARNLLWPYYQRTVQVLKQVPSWDDGMPLRMTLLYKNAGEGADDIVYLANKTYFPTTAKITGACIQ